jgi:hypothetical protein
VWCAGVEVAILGYVDLLCFASKLYYVNYSSNRMLGSPAGTMDQIPVKLGHLKARTVAPQAAATELLVAGLGQWVRFV